MKNAINLIQNLDEKKMNAKIKIKKKFKFNLYFLENQKAYFFNLKNKNKKMK